jgi:hypothetical protein
VVFRPNKVFTLSSIKMKQKFLCYDFHHVFCQNYGNDTLIFVSRRL